MNIHGIDLLSVKHGPSLALSCPRATHCFYATLPMLYLDKDYIWPYKLNNIRQHTSKLSFLNTIFN